MKLYVAILSIAVALSGLFTSAATHAASDEAPPLQRVTLGQNAASYTFALYANHALDGDLSKVHHVVFVLHGVQRNGDDYYAAAHALMSANQVSDDQTLLIAPSYFTAADAKRRDMPDVVQWTSEGWSGGYNAVTRPAISSYAVIDDLLQMLAEKTRLPQLEDIVIAGHSGGGQFVQRYAVLNPVDEVLRARGMAVRYVIANPSSYLYFTSDRPSGDGFAPADAQACSGYNDYRYGLDQMVPYGAQAERDALPGRYAARDVTYLWGTRDIDPNHRVLDKSCAAETQGPYRYARGHAYLRHLRAIVPAERHHAFDVQGIAHDQAGMFGSVCGARLLFGVTVAAGPHTAVCKEVTEQP